MKVKLLSLLVLVISLVGAPGIYQKKKFAVDSTNWTPIVTVMACNSLGIKNTLADDLLLRTDSGDDTTEDSLAVGETEVIGNVFPQPQGGRSTRFLVNETVIYVKAASGTGNVIVSFLR